MGHESIVYGLIAGANRNQADAAHNTAVLASLAETDQWPFLPRAMFTIPPESVQGGHYRTQAIHFGASYSAVEWEWTAWLEKFEALLVRLVWHDVWVHLRTSLVGDYHYHYRPESTGGRDWLHTPDHPAPIWRLRGGPRDFYLATPELISPWEEASSWIFAQGIWTMHAEPDHGASPTEL